MEQTPRLGQSMRINDVAKVLGWTEADKAEHLSTLDARPVPNLDETKERIATRTQ